MGVANGLGSLLYYSGLSRMDASLAHLLYAMYPFWVFIFLSAAGHLVSRLAVVRLALALLSVVLLTWQGAGLVDLLGVTLMIGAGALYGWHLVLGQWSLADVDSRTVTLYSLTTMAVVVGVAWLFQPRPTAPDHHGPRLDGHRPARHLSHRPGPPPRLCRPQAPGRLSDLPAQHRRSAGRRGRRLSPSGRELYRAAVDRRRLFAVSILLIGRDTGLEVADEEAWWRTLFPTKTEVQLRRAVGINLDDIGYHRELHSL